MSFRDVPKHTLHKPPRPPHLSPPEGFLGHQRELSAFALSEERLDEIHALPAQIREEAQLTLGVAPDASDIERWYESRVNEKDYFSWTACADKLLRSRELCVRIEAEYLKLFGEEEEADNVVYMLYDYETGDFDEDLELWE